MKDMKMKDESLKAVIAGPMSERMWVRFPGMGLGELCWLLTPPHAHSPVYNSLHRHSITRRNNLPQEILLQTGLKGLEADVQDSQTRALRG